MKLKLRKAVPPLDGTIYKGGRYRGYKGRRRLRWVEDAPLRSLLLILVGGSMVVTSVALIFVINVVYPSLP